MALWTPLDEPTLKLFLHADDIGGADESAVSAWPDRSSHNNDGSATNGNPVLKVAEVNGKNAIKTSPGLIALPNFLTGATEMSALVVAKSGSNATGGPLLTSGDSFNAAHHPYFTDMYDHFGSNTRYGWAPDANLSNWYLCHFHSAALNWKCYINGSLEHSEAANTVGSWNTAPRVGTGYFIDGSNMFDGMIAAVVFYQDIDDTIRQKVEGWAAWEYGLVANLPEDHPYKLAAPEGGGGGGDPEDPQSVVLTQLALLAVLEAKPDSVLTQLAMLLVVVEAQASGLTQLPILPLTLPRPLPLPIPILPDEPLVETWSWLTVVNAAEFGNEQRASLRDQPRCGQTFTAILLDEADRRQAYDILMRNIGKTFSYPLYQHSVPLTATAESGDTKLFFDPTKTDVRAGEQLAVFDTQLGTTQFLQVTTMDADGADLSAALESDIHRSSLVCPVLEFRLLNNLSISMNSIDGAIQLSMEAVSHRSLVRPGAAPTVVTYDGLTVLHLRPLANTSVEEGFDRNTEWLDFGVAPPEPKNGWDFPSVAGRRSYAVRRPTDMDYWRDIGNRLKGMQKPFLVPTFRDDLPLTEVPTLSSKTLVSSNVEYSAYWRKLANRYLRIENANGYIIRRVLEVALQYDADGVAETSKITLDSHIGAAAGSNVISKVSFANYCRMGSDTIEFEHGQIDSVVNLDIRTVDDYFQVYNLTYEGDS